MKTINAGLLSRLQDYSLRLSMALRLERADGLTLGFTSSDEAVTFDGLEYSPSPGLLVSSVISSAGFDVDNLTLTTLNDGDVFNEGDVLNGLWSGTRWTLFRYDWAAPSDGTEPLLAGVFGTVEIANGSIQIELRSLKQFLQLPVGNVTTKLCRARFADYPTPNGNNLCGLASSDWLESGTVTGVTSRSVFASSGLGGFADDYFGEGLITWLTGDNAGASHKVRSFATSTGTFTLLVPTANNVQSGDTFTVIAGCRKRRDEDCATKFNNVLNFQGEPDLPGGDALLRLPGGGV